MSPTVRQDPAIVDLDVVREVRAPRSARVYSVTLLALAIGLVVVLVAEGHALPSAGALFLLAIPLALCMNRYLLFPNEVGVTGDAAVLFAAMVAFRGDAQWLGPLLLALLVGPLDARHWGARAFSRMAFNSGSTALVTAAGLAVFVPLARELGTGWEATVAAALLAALPYVVAESVLGIALVTLLGERPGRAARHQLPLTALAVPLAVVGAIAGFATLGVGWWLMFLLLLPMPLVPELVFLVVPRRASRLAWLTGAGGVLLASSLLLPAGVAAGVAGVAALSFLAAAECRPTPTSRVMPLLWVPAVACVGLASELGDGGDRLLATVLLATVAGALVLVPAGGWRARAGWALPSVALTACLAGAWPAYDPAGPIILAAGFAIAALLAAVWGPLPWPSRILGPFVVRHHVTCGRGLLLVLGAVAVALATVTTWSTPHIGAALATTAVLEALVMCAAGGIRLWRFAPRRRAAEVGVLALVGLGGLLLLLPAALDGAWSAIAYATVGALTVSAVAWNVRPDSLPEGVQLVRRASVFSRSRK
jgi:hypothetical protein